MSSIKETGLKEATAAIKNMGILSPKLLNVAYEKLIKSRNNILKSMRNTPKQSKTIRVPGRKRVKHHPAKKGNPPAIMTGRLSNDLRVEKNNIRVELGTTIPYAPHLEFKDHQFMKQEFEKLKIEIPKSIQGLLKQHANR